MRKLKRIRDGKVFDCDIVVISNAIKVLYFEDNIWMRESLEAFAPAESGKDY